MGKYLKGFYMSLKMFCGIPLPFHFWDEKSMCVILSCLPLVGGMIGVLWWGMANLLVLSGIHTMLAAAVLAVMPFIVTGFLHIDGFMDTSDAVLSRRPVEEKLRILKDPHIGAFAVIMLAILFLLQFSAAYIIVQNEGNYLLFVVITVISRCCATMSIYCLKIMKSSGYAHMFRQNTGASHKIFTVAVALIVTFSSFKYIGISSLAVEVAVILGYIGAIAYVYKEFKGISGDLTGFAIVISELCGLVALAVI